MADWGRVLFMLEFRYIRWFFVVTTTGNIAILMWFVIICDVLYSTVWIWCTDCKYIPDVSTANSGCSFSSVAALELIIGSRERASAAWCFSPAFWTTSNSISNMHTWRCGKKACPIGQIKILHERMVVCSKWETWISKIGANGDFTSKDDYALSLRAVISQSGAVKQVRKVFLSVSLCRQAVLQKVHN